MDFRIADTFTDSLARLAGEEQKSVKTTAFDLQLNPAKPGMQFHKLEKAKDPHFWSVRVGQDIRLIVHRTASSLMLCYVDHHDAAYRWAERRKIERHPQTGAMQLVEIRESVREIVVPRYVEPAGHSERSEESGRVGGAMSKPQNFVQRPTQPPGFLADARNDARAAQLLFAEYPDWVLLRMRNK